MSIVFLDRNAVISIKKKLEKKKFPPERRRKLRSIDKSTNIITPLLSIYEGNLGKKQNINELYKTILEETKIIKKFFKNAKTDSDFLIDNIENFQNAFKNNWELKWDDYILFLKFSSKFLYQPISSDNKIIFERKIFEKAKELNIPVGHPTVICCLSVLYGSQIIRGILKFKKNMNDKDYYNILSDLMIPIRLQNIKAIIKKHNKNDKIEYFTFDNSLEKFIKRIMLVSNGLVHTKDEVEININITYNKILFPDMSKESFNEFKERLLES